MASLPVLLFSKLNNTFSRYLNAEHIFLGNKNKSFPGGLSDIMANKEALDATWL